MCLKVPTGGKAMNLELSPQEKVTVGIYDQRIRDGDIDTTPVWADSFSSMIFWNLPADGVVVDVGCGTGRFISILSDLNITRYFGIDPSAGNIEYCRQTYPEHQFSLGSVQTLGIHYPHRFSGFIMTTSLMHVPRRDLRRSLRSLRASLLPGANGMISLPVGEPLLWTHPSGVILTLYTEAEMERQLPLHGFSIRQMFVRNGRMLLIHVTAV